MDIEPEQTTPPTSFKTKRINKTTFLVTEDDDYREHPFIYVKVHPEAPVLILSDTGCDEPSDKWKGKKFVHLRLYLEQFPTIANGGHPLNPNGEREYIILCTHCHFDHIGGISQFLAGGTTNIIASAAGRDFIESDLENNGLFDLIDAPAPYYQVTHWAGAFERLKWPLPNLNYPDRKPGTLDLGISIIHTPGHTPDQLAWYDHEEMHLYVGDSFYEEGSDGMPIIWPGQGNLIEWTFSMQKLQYFVKSQNNKFQVTQTIDEDKWVHVPRRVKVGCGHQTAAADAEELIGDVEELFWKIARGQVPVTKIELRQHEVYNTWRERGDDTKLSFCAPVRLMYEAQGFFKGTLL